MDQSPGRRNGRAVDSGELYVPEPEDIAIGGNSLGVRGLGQPRLGTFRVPRHTGLLAIASTPVRRA